MHDKTINAINYSSKKGQKYTQGLPMGKHRLKWLDGLASNKPLALAIVIGSVGTFSNFPQIAQASQINEVVVNPNFSNLGTPSLSLQNEDITKAFELGSGQKQVVDIPKIEIRSSIDLEANSATTVYIPQLPSLILAQNIGNKNITKQIYTVRAGDTINSIARHYGISTNEIIEANNIKDPNKLSINRQLVIPVESQSQVKFPLNTIAQVNSSDTEVPIVTRDISADLISNQVNKKNTQDPYISKLRADIDKLRNQFQSQYREESQVTIDNSSSSKNREFSDANYFSSTVSSPKQEEQNLTSETELSSEEFHVSSAINQNNSYNPLFSNSLLQERLRPQLPPLSSPEEYLPDNSNIFNGYMWPAQGTFTSGYGWRWGRMHKGIDIAAPIGTPILAAATGEVIFAGWNSGGYGNLVKVKHPDGSVTFYAHNNRILVRRGQKIKQGQQIAEMGSTGYSTGPHLHFEIRTNGTTAVNPIALLPKK